MPSPTSVPLTLLPLLLLTLTQTPTTAHNPPPKPPPLTSPTLFPTHITPTILTPNTATLPPPLALRAALYTHLTLWQAFAHYHPTATTLFTPPSPRPPPNHRTPRNINTAMLIALNTLLRHTPPTFGPSHLKTQRAIQALLHHYNLHHNRNNTHRPLTLQQQTAIAIGRRAGTLVAQLTLLDGWNQQGNNCTHPQAPYCDPTAYNPVNPPHTLLNPLRWQPALRSNPTGTFYYTQTHLLPHLGRSNRTLLFTQTPSQAHARTKSIPPPYPTPNTTTTNTTHTPPPPHNLRRLRNAMRAVVRRSARLTERQCILAEFFDNKLQSFNQQASVLNALRLSVVPQAFPDWNLTHDMLYTLGAHLATFDAATLSWRSKLQHDAVRPTSQTLTQTLSPTSETTVPQFQTPYTAPKYTPPAYWRPYLTAMPHSEHPSASACVCTALVEHALHTTNFTDNLPFTLTLLPGTSTHLPDILPRANYTLRIARLTAWRTLCGKSRLWGGVHFSAAVAAGEALCEGVGGRAFEIAQGLLRGHRDDTWMQWLPKEVHKFWEMEGAVA